MLYLRAMSTQREFSTKNRRIALDFNSPCLLLGARKVPSLVVIVFFMRFCEDEFSWRNPNDFCMRRERRNESKRVIQEHIKFHNKSCGAAGTQIEKIDRKYYCSDRMAGCRLQMAQIWLAWEGSFCLDFYFRIFKAVEVRASRSGEMFYPNSLHSKTSSWKIKLDYSRIIQE